jgi:peptide/nickel transport system substrate-binding protein
MRNLRWQLLIVILASVAIALLLLGRQPELQAVEPEPVTGGVYTEALIGSLQRLNPLLDGQNPADRDIDRLLYSRLIRFDARGLPQPDLAEAWGVSKDGTVYNLRLRADAVWHDGRPVTSQDVLFTLELLRGEDSPTPAGLRQFWGEVEAISFDEHHLQFILPEPFAPFLDYLSFGILPAHLLQGLTIPELVDAPFNLQPVGSGPYRFEELLVEEGQITGLVLSAFDDYYVQRPFIDQIVFRYYPDQIAALEAYRQGEVLGISQVGGAVLSQALAESDLDLFSGRLPQLSMVFLNLDDPQAEFFQDQLVREALMLGLNRQWLIDRLLDGQAIIADGPIFPGTWAYFEGIKQYPFDPDKAISLLKSAGYTVPAEGGSVRSKDGVRLRFTLLHPDDATHTQMAEAIQRNWAVLGARVDLEPLDLGTLIEDRLELRAYEAALVDLDLTNSPDPDPYPFWHQTQVTGGQNYAMWDDRPASEFLEQARISVDLDERTRLYRNFQVRFGTDLPALPLYYPVYSYAVDSQVQGISIGPLYDTSDRFNNVIDWFLLARRALATEALPSEVPPTAAP